MSIEFIHDHRKVYVLGFMFNEDLNIVALIKKNRPQWQAGLLNGIGGHLEDSDETIWHGQAREFFEETGVQTIPEDWDRFAIMENEKCIVHVFRAFSNNVFHVSTTTDEEIHLDPVRVSPEKLSKRIRNLTWLIPLALDQSAKSVDAKFS